MLFYVFGLTIDVTGRRKTDRCQQRSVPMLRFEIFTHFPKQTDVLGYLKT